jgi:hypothetical protein
VRDGRDTTRQAEFAAVLAGMPRSWQSLLTAHVSGPDGRCRGCRSQVAPAPRWPCALYCVAARARRIAAGRTAGPDDPPRPPGP